MNAVILLFALGIETIFAVYCIRTRSSHTRLKNYLRLGALLAFVLLALLTILQWSFRWYGLAALVCLWGALGLWGLFRAKPQPQTYTASRVLRSAIVTLLLICLAMVPALIFPQYKAPRVTGSHRVATVTYTYVDASRVEAHSTTGASREVNVEFWYPADAAGRYPLVVFSHGAGGVKASNTSTFLELASHGYVVCSIDHPYDSLYTVDAAGHVITAAPAFLQEIQDLNSGKYDEATKFQLQQGWMQGRAADINFVLDTILSAAADAQSGPVYQRVDTARIGLMGHSLGAESSALVARQRSDIGTVVALDADLGGEYVSYAHGKYVLNDNVYPVPLLSILADDVVRLIAAVPDARDVVALEHVVATAPHAYQVHIAGTDHQSVTDLPLISPLMVSMITSAVPRAGGGEAADKLYVIETMNELVLRFFNTYLKGEGTFTPAAAY